MTRALALAVAALVAFASVVAGGVAATAGAQADADASSALLDGGLLQQNNESVDDGPTAHISVPSTVQVGERVVLDGSGSTGSIESYTWTTTYGSQWSGETRDHYFPRSGEQTVTLTVTAADGDTDTATATVDVTEQSDDGNLDAALSLSKQRVAASETFTMDVSNTTTNGNLVGYWFSTDDDPTLERAHVTTTRPATCIDEPGTYTISVLAVEPGHVDRATATIVVEPSDAGGDCYVPGENDDAGGPSNTGGATAGSTDASYDPGGEINVDRSGDAVSVDANDVPADRDLTVALSTRASDAAVTFGDLSVDLRRDNSFQLDADAATTAPDGTTAPSTAGFAPVGYLTVETSHLEPWAFDGASVSFSVDGDRLAAADATPADVSLYRWTGDAWSRVGTTDAAWNASTPVDANATYAFDASLDGFSTFAVGVAQPSIQVQNVTVHDRDLGVGDTAEVIAVVGNDGTVNGTANVTFRMGDVVRNRTVTVPANDTARLTFIRLLAEPGERTASVGNESVSFQVAADETTTTSDGSDDAADDAADTTTSTPTTAGTTATPSTDSSGQPGFGVAVALVSFAAAALLARRRR